jgi:hypothetical protein
MKLTELVNRFALLKLKVTTQLTAPLCIGFAGDMLHNNFGIALKAVDPQLASDIYQTDGQVKQFVLTPDAPLKRQYVVGETLSFELTLFNQLCTHLPKILQALSVWQQQGYIPDKQRHLSARFILTAIDCDTPLMPSQRLFAFNQWSNLPQPYLLADALDGIFQHFDRIDSSHSSCLGAAITLHSPLRLTFENNELRQQPSADIYFNAIARRLWLLAKTANLVDDTTEVKDDYYNSIPSSANIRLVNHNVEFTDLKRLNGRNNQSKNLGGLMGDIQYQDLNIHHLALLEIGKLLNIGNKTTFGFGAYQWQLLVW